MAKYLFLDIDGVLNTNPAPTRALWRTTPDRILKNRVKVLNRVLEATGAHVVISSNWRLVHDLDTLSNTLASRGLRAPVVGRTHALGADKFSPDRREAEILQWVERAGWPTHWAAVDDHPMPGLGHRVVQTHPERGLTDVEANKLVRVLGGV